jgi:ribosomal protein S28E/S33
MALAPQAPDSAPHGTVQFRVDGVARGGPITVQGAAAVSPPIAGLAPGIHDVRGSYSGDEDFAPAEAVLSLPVVVAPPASGGGGPAPTATTVTASPNPSDAGQAVTVTATIAPAANDGTVAFSADGRALDGCATLTPSAGVAVCRVTGLGPGPHELRATYSGSTRSGGSSGSVMQTVVGVAAASVSPPHGASVALSCAGPVAITSVRIRHSRLEIAGRAGTALAGRRVTILLHGRSIAHVTLRRDGTFRVAARRPHGRHWRRARLRAMVAGQRSAAVPIAPRIAVVGRTPMSGGRLRVRARVAGGGRHRVVARQLAVCAGGARVVGTATTDRRGRVAITLPGAGWYRLRVGHGGPRSLAIVVATPPA